MRICINMLICENDMYVCVCERESVCVYTYIYIFVCVRERVCVCAYIHVDIYLHLLVERESVLRYANMRRPLLVHEKASFATFIGHV